MKKLTVLLVVGMLISVSGCTAVAGGGVAAVTLTYGPGLVLGIAILQINDLATVLDVSTECEGGAWFVEPNEPIITGE